MSCIAVVEDDILRYFIYLSEKIKLDISYKLSAMQTIHKKYQALLSQKIEKKNQILACHLLLLWLAFYGLI